jgi:hypothetical protein
MEAPSGCENSCDLALKAEIGAGAAVTRLPRARTRNTGPREQRPEDLEEAMMMGVRLKKMEKEISCLGVFEALYMSRVVAR